MGTREDLKGRRFNKLLVLDYVKTGKRAHWRCLCDCGSLKVIRESHIKHGLTKSCGCFKKHGLSKHELYFKWSGMHARCYNKNHQSYKYYGGRGITVDNRWHNVSNFIKDMNSSYKKGLLLDRIDVNGPYSKENCKWISSSKQGKNRRNNVNMQSNIDYVSYRKNRWGVTHSFVNKKNAEEFAKRVQDIFKELDDKPRKETNE